MTIEFQLPDLGENIESGDVVNVLVKPGDQIQANTPVVEIETDKATVEVPCPQAGRVVEIKVQPGDTVPVGGVILTLDGAGGGGNSQSAPTKQKPAAAAPATPKAPSKPAPKQPEPAEEEDDIDPEDQAELQDEPDEPAAAQQAAPKPQKPASPQPSAPAPAPAAPADSLSGMRDNAPAGPAVRRLARELGVDLARVKPTGVDGRITRDDVVRSVRETNVTTAAVVPSKNRNRPQVPPGTVDQDSWGTVRRERLTKIRKTIATNMSRSATTIPHVTNFDDADVTELERIRKESAADYVDSNVKLTMLAFVIKAVASSLKLHPMLNSTLDLETEQIIYKEYINVGVAVDTERGLVVPVIRNVDHMSIPQIAESLQRLANQARANQFSLEDLRGGSFTLSNLGAVGGQYSTPIINYPEIAVLLVGRSRKQPVVGEGDKIGIRLMMPLSISYDHRLIDGATAARFLNEVISYLQAPGRLLLAP
jgi:pyruvate/2-oxoglutarate dehydrogenase complex dihydrolipoamide acyltransferase (E2) component